MPRFIDEIDRLFEVLVHEAWRTTRPVRQAQPMPERSVVELRLPVPHAGRSDIAFKTEGRLFTVTVRQRAAGSDTGSVGEARQEEEYLQQTFTLPADTEPAAIETRFENGELSIRISLRKSGTP